MQNPIPKVDTADLVETEPPKPVSLVARMIAATEAVTKRRASKRAQLAGEDAVDKLPWWKRRSAAHSRVLEAVGGSMRTQRRLAAKNAEAFMPASKDPRAKLTKAQRKRRNKEARARA